MQVIECRNTEQIREDDLLKAHTDILRLLNDVIPGMGCTYRGEQRELMVKFRDRLAQAIEVGDATPPDRWSMFNAPWSVMLRYTVWGPRS